MSAAEPTNLRYVTSTDGTAIALEQVTDGPRTMVTVSGGPNGRVVWAEVARHLDGSHSGRTISYSISSVPGAGNRACRSSTRRTSPSTSRGPR